MDVSQKQNFSLRIHQFDNYSNGCVSTGPVFAKFTKENETVVIGDLGYVHPNQYGLIDVKLISTLIELSKNNSCGVLGKSLILVEIQNSTLNFSEPREKLIACGTIIKD